MDFLYSSPKEIAELTDVIITIGGNKEVFDKYYDLISFLYWR